MSSNRFAICQQENSLELGDFSLRDKDIKEIIQLINDSKKIDTVNLSNNRELTAEGIAEFARNIKGVCNVNLAGTATDEICEAFAINNTCVTYANFSGRRITDKGLSAFVKYNKFITSANFGYNNITANGIDFFVKNNKVLSSLDLTENKIGDDGAKSLGLNNTSINKINLSDNGITDKGAEALSENKIFDTVVLDKGFDYSKVPSGDMGVFGYESIPYNNISEAILAKFPEKPLEVSPDDLKKHRLEITPGWMCFFGDSNGKNNENDVAAQRRAIQELRWKRKDDVRREKFLSSTNRLK